MDEWMDVDGWTRRTLARGKSRIWGEKWLGNFFHKPCNNELFVRQSLNMEISIAKAQKMKINWHIHIDTDELLYPGGAGAKF